MYKQKDFGNRKIKSDVYVAGLGFLSYFFYKKIPLSRRVEYVTGQWVSE